MPAEFVKNISHKAKVEIEVEKSEMLANLQLHLQTSRMSKVLNNQFQEMIFEAVEVSKSADSPRFDEVEVEEVKIAPNEAFENSQSAGLLNERADQNSNFVVKPGVILYE